MKTSVIPLIIAASVAATEAQEAPVEEFPVMVVVASRVPEPLNQVVANVSVVDRDDMDRRIVQDVSQLVRYVPGVRIDENADRFGRQGFAIRGLGGNRVRIEIDGVPLPDSFSVGQFAAAGRDLADIEVVRRVEILRGPASTLYGSDALAGLVAFHTLDPSDLIARGRGATHFGVRAAYAGRDDSFLISGSWAGAVAPGIDAMLVAARREGRELENRASDPAHAPNPADYARTALLGKMVYDTGDAGRYTLTLEHAAHGQTTDVHSQVFAPGRFATTYRLDADDRHERDRASVRYERGSLDVLAYTQHARVRQDTAQYRLPDSATPFESLRERRFLFSQRDRGVDVVGQHRHDAGRARHWHVFGVQARRTTFSGLRDGVETDLESGATRTVILGESFPVRDFPDSAADRIAAFWQDEISWSRFAVIPGVRVELYRLDARADAVFAEDFPDLVPANVTETSVTPKLGVRWSVSPRASVFVQYARGFRAPPFGDVNIGLSLPALNYEVRANPDLRPERSDGVEAGWRWTGESVRATVSVYENRYRDLIESRANLGVDPDTGALVFQSVNRDRARVRGVEAEGTVKLGSFVPGLTLWQLRGAAAWARGDDTARGRPLNGIDPATVTLGLQRHAADGRSGLELATTAVGAVRRVDEEAGPLFRPGGHAVFDAYWWIEPRDGVRVNLAMLNVGDRRYWDWGRVRGVPAGAADLDFYTQPGRSVSIGVSVAL